MSGGPYIRRALCPVGLISGGLISEEIYPVGLIFAGLFSGGLISGGGYKQYYLKKCWKKQIRLKWGKGCSKTLFCHYSSVPCSLTCYILCENNLKRLRAKWSDSRLTSKNSFPTCYFLFHLPMLR